MEFLAVAAICVLLFIVKGGLPGPVCVLIFLGYCAYKIYVPMERNSRIQAEKDFKEQLEEERKKAEIEERKISGQYYTDCLSTAAYILGIKNNSYINASSPFYRKMNSLEKTKRCLSELKLAYKVDPTSGNQSAHIQTAKNNYVQYRWNELEEYDVNITESVSKATSAIEELRERVKDPECKFTWVSYQDKNKFAKECEEEYKKIMQKYEEYVEVKKEIEKERKLRR